MTAEPTIERCPNCGAPLQLDAGGLCVFCRMHVTIPEARDTVDGVAGDALTRQERIGLNDDGVGLTFPVFRPLSGLCMLSSDPVPQESREQPSALEPARAPVAAAKAAAFRVMDAGLDEKVVLYGEKIYTPDEIWVFNLTRDLLGVL